MKKNLVLVFILSATGAFSQETALLTFNEAVKIAMEKNVTLNTQKNQLFSNQARKLQGYANYLPNLNAQGFAQRTDGLQIDPTTGQGGNITSDYVQANVNANYTIFNGLNRINTLKQNNLQFDAQTSLVERTKQDVIFNVASQYLQVLLDQELLRIAQENLQTQKVVLEQMQGLVDAGVRATADLYTQDAQVKNLEVTKLRATVALENDRALLAQTLQADPAIHFEVVTPDWNNEYNLDYIQKMSLDSLYAVAVERRADLKQQKFNVEAFRHGMRANTSGYMPTVTLFGSYGSTFFSANPAAFDEQFKRLNPQTSYGVNLTIPIFDRLQTHTLRATGRVNYDNAKLTEENLVKTIKIDVKRVYQNFLSAVESYKASQVQYQAGELALKTQQESYQLGVSTQVALALANQIFVQGAASKAQAEVTLIFQRILLEYAVGSLNIDNLLK